MQTDYHIHRSSDSADAHAVIQIEMSIAAGESDPSLKQKLASLHDDFLNTISQPQTGFFCVATTGRGPAGYAKGAFIPGGGLQASCLVLIKQHPEFRSAQLWRDIAAESVRAVTQACEEAAIPTVQTIYLFREEQDREATETSSAKLRLYKRLEIMQLSTKLDIPASRVPQGYSVLANDAALNTDFWQSVAKSLPVPVDCFDQPLEAVQQWAQAEIPHREVIPLTLRRDSDGHIVGTMFPYIMGKTGWCEGVSVDPDCRGKGLSTLLISHALDVLLSKGAATIMANVESLLNPISKRTFQRHGFQTISISDIMVATT